MARRATNPPGTTGTHSIEWRRSNPDVFAVERRGTKYGVYTFLGGTTLAHARKVLAKSMGPGLVVTRRAATKNPGSAKWARRVHPRPGALLGGKKLANLTPKQIVETGLKLARKQGVRDPAMKVGERLQFLINVGSPYAPKLKKAKQLLAVATAKKNPAGETLPQWQARVAREQAERERRLKALPAKRKNQLRADVRAVSREVIQGQITDAELKVLTKNVQEITLEELAQINFYPSRSEIKDAFTRIYNAGGYNPGSYASLYHTDRYWKQTLGKRETTVAKKSKKKAAPKKAAKKKKRKAPTSPGAKLAGAIMKATGGKIASGTSQKVRGGIIKKANAELQGTSPTPAKIKSTVEAIIKQRGVWATSSTKPAKKKAAKKKSAKKKPAKKKAAKKKSPKKKPAKKKAAKKKPAGKSKRKTPAQAFSARVQRVVGKATSKYHTTPKQRGAIAKSVRAKCGKRRCDVAELAKYAKASIPASLRKKAAKPRKQPRQKPRKQAIAGKKEKKGYAPGSTGKNSPSLKQRNVAAAWGNKGRTSRERNLINLTAAGLPLGEVGEVYYRSSRTGESKTYKHRFKAGKGPKIWIDAHAYNALDKARGGKGDHVPAKRKGSSLRTKWVEVEKCIQLVIRPTKGGKNITLAFDKLKPAILVDENNKRMAITWSSFSGVPHNQRVMAYQTSGEVITTRGIVS